MKAMKSKAQSKKAVVSVTLDRTLKTRAQKKASELGLTLGEVVNTWLREFAGTDSGTATRELRPTPYLEKIIKEAQADYKAGKNIYGPFSTKEELRTFLKSQ